MQILIVVLLMIAARESWAESEIVYVKVKLSGDFKGDLQEEQCHLPSNVNIDVAAGDTTLTLRAVRSSTVTQHVPTYIIDSLDGLGSEIRRVANTDSEIYALYHDKDNAAALAITCPTQGQGAPLVEGTVIYKGRPHHLQLTSWRRHPVRVELSEPEYHLQAVSHPANESGLYDYQTLEMSTGAENLESISPRHRRQASHGDVIIDVIAIVAYDSYNDFYHQSTKTTPADKASDTLTRVRKHFAMVLSEADLTYQRITTLPFKISLRLVGYLVAETSNASPWTEQIKEVKANFRRPLINSDQTLKNIETWIASTKTLRASDYYVLFTNYDLYKNEATGIKNSFVGIATVSGMCNPGKNAAVVEASNFAESILTTAHEIGHGIGAEHDGTGNDCRSSDNYVMGTTTISVNESNVANYGKFSPCSIHYFSTQIAKLSVTHNQCIHEAASPIDVPSVAGEVPGQISGWESQCREIFGSTSFLCTGITHLSDPICTHLWCHVPGTTSKCESTYALRGTSCGNKKWCVNGRCVSATAAPSMDESCPYGDQRTPPFTHSNLTCQQAIAAQGFQCYTPNTAKNCCQACGKLKQNTPGCEYGDKASNCQVSKCSQYTAASRSMCCRTCHH